MAVEIKLPVITEYGTFNGLKIDEGLIDTLIFNWNVEPKPLPVKIGHIKPDDQSKDKELADGMIKTIFKQGGQLWALAEIPDEVYRYILEGRLFATSPEIIVEVLNDKGDKNYKLKGLALLGNSEPAIPSNYLIKFSNTPPLRVLEFKKVEKDTFYSHFRKSDWSEEDVLITTEWDKDKAMKEIVEKKGWETLARCCLAVLYKEGEDTSTYPEAFTRYKFPFAELKDGKLVINSKAVATAKAYLNGARGVNIQPELAELVEPLVEYLDELVQKTKEMSKQEVLFKQITPTETNTITERFIKAFENLGLKIRR